MFEALTWIVLLGTTVVGIPVIGILVCIFGGPKPGDFIERDWRVT